jgi:stage V sporulation protein R
MNRLRPKISVDRDGLRDPHWESIGQDISDFCHSSYGLNYPDIRFHIVDLPTHAGIVAANGYPISPPTWQLHQEAEKTYLGHRFGNYKVYEIVCPAGGILDKNGVTQDPLEAFIYETDSPTDTKLVISHVFGHAHVFTNNRFSVKARVGVGYDYPYTEMVKLTKLVEDLYEEHGVKRVMPLLDAVEAVSSLVPYTVDVNPDANIWGMGRYLPEEIPRKGMFEDLDHPHEDDVRERLKEKPQMLPQCPENNVFALIERNALLKPWERDLVNAYARMLQYQKTVVAPIKILHEGFASFIDLRFGMENAEHVPNQELMRYIKSRTNGFAHSQGQINPYGFGFGLLSYAMKQWSEGRYGVEYNKSMDLRKRLEWGKYPDYFKGWNKVLELSRDVNDYQLIDQMFDKEFFAKHARDFFVRGVTEGHKKELVHYIASREFNMIKKKLLFGTANAGQPYFYVPPDGANHNQRHELLVKHDVGGLVEIYGERPEIEDFFEDENDRYAHLTLDPGDLRGVLMGLHRLWKRPVSVETITEEGEPMFYRYDGKKMKVKI